MRGDENMTVTEYLESLLEAEKISYEDKEEIIEKRDEVYEFFQPLMHQ